MDAPKCRLCGERHYGLCPSTQAAPKTKRLSEPKSVTLTSFLTPEAQQELAERAIEHKRQRLKGGDASAIVVERQTANRGRKTTPGRIKAPVAQRIEQRPSKSRAAGSSPAGRAKFDRTAYHREYMREYMRKRRAKRKDDGD